MEATVEKTAFEKYPAYKDSGVEWLGDVPKHWNLVANRFIFHLKKELVGKHASRYTLLSLTLDGVIKRDMDNPQGKFPAEFDTYQKVSDGDFIFCLFDVEETPRTVGLSPFSGMITGAYTVMRVDQNFDKKFLYYFYYNLDADKRLKPLYTGLRNTITKDNFFSLKTFVPPIFEQTVIANFLDQKTAQIDQVIAQKEQQIELLKERRQVLIHKAVTRGLNPDVPLKDSGVQWIGKVPEHWEVKRLSVLGRFSKGGGISRAELTEEGLPAILYGDIYTKYDISIDNVINRINSETAKRAVQIKKGDLLFTGSGETMEDIGKCVLYDAEESAYAGGDVIIYHTNFCNQLYLSFVLNTDAVKYEKARFSKGEIIVHTYGSKLKDIKVPIPPLDEQFEISAFLSNNKKLTEIAISKKKNEIEKLKEYKATLINSAVTGKIKVGQWL